MVGLAELCWGDGYDCEDPGERNRRRCRDCARDVQKAQGVESLDDRRTSLDSTTARVVAYSSGCGDGSRLVLMVLA